MSNRERQNDPTYDFALADDDADFATRIIHHGESPHASAFPIYQANTVDGVYIRQRNPTVEALEEKIRALEGGAGTVAMGSGMAAVSHTLFELLGPGDRMIVHHSLFVGVRTLFNDYLSKLGIVIDRVDLNNTEELSQALERPARLLYFEVVGNPNVEVVDAPAVIETARRYGVLVVVDNTLLTPFLYRPIESGADVVIHSATKYLSGHGDVLAGVATFRDAELGRRIHKSRRILGGLLSPLSAFLIMRGMKTLPMRMKQHCDNAQAVALYLERHPRVRSVAYPGLTSSADHDRASAFLPAFGGMISMELDPPFEWGEFSTRLKVCRPGMSFGDAATRIQREGTIRLSVGLEAASDIIRDLEMALAT